MSRIKVVLLGLVALVVVGAVAATSASAATETRFFVEGSEVKGAEVFNVEGTSGTSELESEIAGLKVIIVCKKDVFTGEIEKTGLSKGEVKFEECKVFEIKNGTKTELTACTVPNITFKFKDSLVHFGGSSAEDEFQPNAGTLFVEFTISGISCVIKGTYKVKTVTEGKGQICALPGGEIEAVQHTILCSSTGSKELRLGENQAGFFSTDTVNVAGGKKWRG